MPPIPAEQRPPHPSRRAAPLQVAQSQQRSAADDGGLIPKYIRFADLKERGIAGNWPFLLRLIDKCGFPAGVMLSENTRAWTETEVAAWLATRKVDKKVVNIAKANATRAEKKAAKAAAGHAPTAALGENTC
jgi:hypothetical protein